MSTLAARARRLVVRSSERLPPPSAVIMSRADAEQLFADAGVNISERELDAMAIHVEDDDETPPAP